MDRLSEEEIMKDLKKYISFANKSENFSNDNDFKWNKELSQRILGLLDLYNKEKDKNKELDRESKVKQTSDEFTNETRYYTPEGELYETIIETYKCPKNYISKDKIRDLLHSYSVTDERFMKYLQELLEERN